jgi:hypothetical protein
VVRNLYRAKSTNGVRRIYLCHACDHRWNVWEGMPPGPDYRRKSYPERRPLTEEQVRVILLDRTTPHLEMGRRLDPPKSYSTIKRVRYGSLCAHLAPEIPRWNVANVRTCRDCINWRGGCVLGIPEPVEEGVGFAVECALFAQVKGGE